MAETFADFIERDRQRIGAELERLRLERSKIGDAMFALEKELAAIAAYESTRLGKSAPKPATARATRRGSKREEIVAVIKSSDGLTRGELLEKLGLKGSKQGEMSCSNALTNLVKNGSIIRDGGRYRVAA